MKTLRIIGAVISIGVLFYGNIFNGLDILAIITLITCTKPDLYKWLLKYDD